MKTFLASYPFRGDRYNIEIVAEDADEAQARLTAMCFAHLDGELMAKIPVPTGSRLWRAFLRGFIDGLAAPVAFVLGRRSR